jgi:hypothetical protein
LDALFLGNSKWITELHVENYVTGTFRWFSKSCFAGQVFNLSKTLGARFGSCLIMLQESMIVPIGT